MKEEIVETVFDLFGLVLRIGVIIGLIICLWNLKISNVCNNEIRHETVTIISIYEENSLYFVDIIDNKNMPYKIEITKSDFIKYKVNDKIKVTIKNAKAKLAKDQ